MDQIIEINRQRFFSLAEAEELLPLVYRMTEDVSKDVKKMMHCLEALPDKKSDRAIEIESSIDAAIERWQKKISRLGAVPKGLWLADFDNGRGYWCWKYPETAIRHHHGYQDGFSGRRLIESSLGDQI